MSSFSQQASKGLQNQINDFALRFTFVGKDYARDLINKTPFGRPELWFYPVAPKGYKAGTLRNDWRFDVGRYNHKQRNKPRKSGTDAVQEAIKSFNIAKSIIKKGKDTFVTFTNNQPYAYRIEFEGHSRKQAPSGMARIAYSRSKQTARKNGFKI